MSVLNLVAYAVVAGVVAFGVSYAVSLLIDSGDALVNSSFAGVFVAVIVGACSALLARRNSAKK